MKKRNRSIVGMVAVLMIAILLFTTVAEAGSRPYNPPGQVPSAEPATSSTPSAPASGEPANKKWLILNGGTKTVYDTENEAKKATTTTQPTLIFETPIGDVEPATPFPSNPDYKMNEKTGKFTTGNGQVQRVLEPDSIGNYEVKQGNNVVARGVKIQLRDEKGPKTDPNAYVIQEEDLQKNTISLRTGATATKPIPLDMYNDLVASKGEMIKGITLSSNGASVIETVSGATYTIDTKPLVSTGSTTLAGGTRSNNGVAETDQNSINDIQVTTVTETPKGQSPISHKQYNFEKTGIKGEEVDGRVVLSMKDDTKIYTHKTTGDFETGIAAGGIPVEVQGKSYDYTMTRESDGSVTLKRPKQEKDKYDTSDIKIKTDGTKTESRYTLKGGNVVDFESAVTTDEKGRVTEKVERTSTGFFDVGKVDFGFWKWGGNEGNQLQKTVYGPDGKTYTQVSTEFGLNKDGTIEPGSNFDPKDSKNFNTKLISYDPDTGVMTSYPAGFNPNDPRSNPKSDKYDPTFTQDPGTPNEKKVGSKFGFGDLFGTPEEIKPKNPDKPTPEEKAKLEAYNKGVAAERSARFASAQDYAATFGQLSSLFADNGAFKAWSRRTDVLFNNWIMGGSEYRVSKICEKKLRKIPANVLVVQTPGGQLITAAFVNGERQAFKNPINNSVEYLYKISYKVNIPESLIDKAEVHIRQRIRAIDDPVPAAPARIIRKDPGTGQRLEEFLAEGPFFNVILSGKSGRKCLFIDSGSKKCEGESVKKGANAVQRNMFVKYSPNDYNRVCIEFTRSLEFANRKANSICAEIVGVNDQPRNVVDVPEVPTENPSMGADGTVSDARAGAISTTATGQIITADI